MLTGAAPPALRAGERQRNISRARSIVAWIACEHLAWPTGEVAAAIGVSAPAVVRARTIGSTLLAAAGIGPEVILVQAGAGRAKSEK